MHTVFITVNADHRTSYSSVFIVNFEELFSTGLSISNVVDLFKSIQNKKDCKFIQLDIKVFYPSITEHLLNKSIDFRKQHADILEENIQIIKRSRKSVLFHQNES